jgi:hypothetical protein
MLDPVRVDADGDVGGLVANLVGFLDLHHQGVEVDDRIYRPASNGRPCHALTSSATASVMLEIVSWLNPVPGAGSRWA